MNKEKSFIPYEVQLEQIENNYRNGKLAIRYKSLGAIKGTMTMEHIPKMNIGKTCKTKSFRWFIYYIFIGKENSYHIKFKNLETKGIFVINIDYFPLDMLAMIASIVHKKYV